MDTSAYTSVDMDCCRGTNLKTRTTRKHRTEEKAMCSICNTQRYMCKRTFVWVLAASTLSSRNHSKTLAKAKEMRLVQPRANVEI